MDYQQIQAMDIIFKSYFALDPRTGLPISTAFTLAADGLGGINWTSPVAMFSTYGGKYNIPTLSNLPATLSTQTSDIAFVSTVTISTLNYLVTSYGLFQSQVTPQQLKSTIDTLGVLGYISTPTTNYLSSLIGSNTNDISSLYGITSNQSTAIQFLAATSTSMDTYLLTQLSSQLSTYTAFILTPSLQNLGTAVNPGNSYISSFTLQSTIEGLPNAGFITAPVLQQTVNSLGSLGYVSTATLQSSLNSFFKDISTSIYAENVTGNVFIRNSQVTFQGGTPVSIVYLSSLYLSSIPYTGTTGVTGTVSNTFDIVFSSFQLNTSLFIPYITSTSRVFVDFYPAFAFSKVSVNATAVPVLTMSTVIQQGNTVYPNVIGSATFIPVHGSVSYPNGVVDGVNIFNQPMRFQLSTGQLLAAPTTPVTLIHTVKGGYSIFPTNPNALHTSNLTIYPSPNSVFLTIHNPPY